MATIQRIVPCLWFDNEAEQAARFYVSVFGHSEIGAISHYGKEGFDIHRRPEGSVLTVSFKLMGQEITALNGGPEFKFNEAISLQVFCDDQKEVDRLWAQLGADGEPGQCGWLKDKFGLSWQIVPTKVPKMLADKDTKKTERVMKALMQMRKLDIAELERAYEGR